MVNLFPAMTIDEIASHNGLGWDTIKKQSKTASVDMMNSIRLHSDVLGCFGTFFLMNGIHSYHLEAMEALL